MVKLTIVGRVNDGLPLAQGPRYVNEEEENDNFSTYKQQGEFILKEISRAALPHTKMTIRIDHHCFKYPLLLYIIFLLLLDATQLKTGLSFNKKCALSAIFFDSVYGEEGKNEF